MINDLKLIAELKLDISNEYESKETEYICHSEQIRTKLNKWKSNNSKVVATNTIDNFLEKTNESNDKNQNNCTEKCIEDQISIIPSKCVEITEIDDKKNRIVELTQEESVDDKNPVILVDNSNITNIELIEYSENNSNDKNSKNLECLKIVAEKSHIETNLKNYDFVTEANMSENKNLNLKDTKINFNLTKIETDINIEIDASIASVDRKYVIVETNIEQIKQRLKSIKSRISEKQKIKTRFYATIDPNKNVQAESELSREISKDMFSRVSSDIIFLL